MKLSNLKKWLPGMILGLSLLAAAPVSASITNSGSTPPPIDFSKVSSTNDVSQNSDDSGNIYDFKDSRTSGVVVVTKTWEDSLSNDERPVPDVSISTEKPTKSPLGYTITYHGNGLTFSDGSTENEIIVNSSGKIISGQYKIPENFAYWSSSTDSTTKIEVSDTGIPINGITSDIDLYGKEKTYILTNGTRFNKLMPDSTTEVIFSSETKPSSATLIDVDEDGDGSIVAWMEGSTMKISSQDKNKKIISSPGFNGLFSMKENLVTVDFSNLDTSNATTMAGLFYSCDSLASVDISSLITKNVTDMTSMFGSCRNLTSLDLSYLDTHNVTNMNAMLQGCYNLTNLNISGWVTSKVTNFSYMFYGCNNLTNIDTSALNTSKAISMNNMFHDCKKLYSLDVTSFDTSNVTSMNYMFCNCFSLITLDLSSFRIRSGNPRLFNCRDESVPPHQQVRMFFRKIKVLSY